MFVVFNLFFTVSHLIWVADPTSAGIQKNIRFCVLIVCAYTIIIMTEIGEIHPIAPEK